MANKIKKNTPNLKNKIGTPESPASPLCSPFLLSIFKINHHPELGICPSSPCLFLKFCNTCVSIDIARHCFHGFKFYTNGVIWYIFSCDFSFSPSHFCTIQPCEYFHCTAASYYYYSYYYCCCKIDFILCQTLSQLFYSKDSLYPQKNLFFSDRTVILLINRGLSSNSHG